MDENDELSPVRAQWHHSMSHRDGDSWGLSIQLDSELRPTRLEAEHEIAKILDIVFAGTTG